VVVQTADDLIIRDLDSLNGTFVNDVPVRERPLSNGDKIAIGDSIFLCVREDESNVQGRAGSIDSDNTAVLTVDLARLSPEEFVYLHRTDPGSAIAASRLTKNLNTLLDFSSAISSISTIDELQRRLLISIAEIIPAESSAFLQFGPDETEVESICAWTRKGGIGARVQTSQTVIGQVSATRTALLAKRIISDGPLSSADSLFISQTQSVICAPILSVGVLLGVIYVATSDPNHQFDEDHLQLLTALASVAAVAVRNARHVELLRGENRRLQDEINLNHNMVGESAAMRQIYQAIAKVAQSDSTVLITGESGTGKELVARAIHQNSARSDKPFIAINCAAIPETLLESELFGTEKGAYTGASLRKGRLETADGGTVLLDEIGELPLTVQAKLLRVLQERKFERLGGVRPIPVNVRWLAATNRDLKEEAKKRTFREDLYFRLQVITVRMPSLRDRRDDIPLLAGYFALRHSKMCGRPVKGISPEARARLVHYDWPGNVRELENTIERAIVLGNGDYVLAEDLNEELFEKNAPEVHKALYHEAVMEAKRRIVEGALDRAQGNITEAARELGIHPNNLHRLIRNLGIR
jgi:Nif-specific regulatory protein